MSFWAELKRRRVIRVAGVYAVVAWLTIQVAATTFPHLMLPGWTVRLVVALALLGFPVAVALTWLFEITPEGVKRTAPVASGGRSARPVLVAGILVTVALSTWGLTYLRATPAGSARTPITSIAVLPFADMSPDRDQEYFGDGIAEELLDALAGVEGLQVASRTSAFSFKGRNASIREIAAELGVQSVLEGSIRKDADRVRITAQLIDARTDRHLWSETYERSFDDIFSVQEEISRAIVRALQVRLAGGDSVRSLVRVRTADPAAYELYLQGRFFWHHHDPPRSYRRAIDRYERALEIDSMYAPAYAGLADAWSDLAGHGVSQRAAFARAGTAARRAVELDPMSAETHAALGWVQLWHEWDLRAAGQSLAHAVALEPGNAIALDAYAKYLSVTGRVDEALAMQRRGSAADPLIAWLAGEVGDVLALQGRFEQALAQYEKTLEIDPENIATKYSIATLLIEMGRVEEGVRRLEELTASDGNPDDPEPVLALAYAIAGRTREARKILERFSLDSELVQDPAIIALAYVEIGEMDAAFRWVDHMVRHREAGLLSLFSEPRAAPIREDPRFGAVRELVRWP